LLIVPFPKAIVELNVTGKNAILNNFEALSQIVRYLMRSNATICDQVRFA
jgi:hypothetical protein